ncbi:MAG TPA: ATP-dependent RecD-like DNA helicase [Fibrobacteria bacterium]|nr:ATP-dependent RecD-like DNA helicase [Fibrobacteria bacterium]
MPLKAVVKIVTFHNPDNGYSVLRLTEAGSQKTFTAVGHFPKLSPGETVELEGEWTRHETFGEQFKATGHKLIPPDSLEAVERYLGGGILKGVGPGLARKLVARFGKETFEVLDRHPERLSEVPRLGAKARRTLLNSWQENKGMREVLYFLQSHNLSANMSARIYKHYGAQAVDVLRRNPYLLAEEVWGVGFVKADEIAMRLGFGADSYERIRAGLAHALSRSAEEGHVFLPREDLLQRAEALLRCDAGKIVFTLDNLAAGEQVRREEGKDGAVRFYLPWLWHCERGIARRLGELSGTPPPLRAALVDDAVRAAEDAFGTGRGRPAFEYSEQQRGGIRDAVGKGVFLLTGGPGTGKTTTVLGILEVLKRAGLKVRLAAPTGRAAKRMAEVTGSPASTLHRLLKYDPAAKAFTHDELSPLDCEALVVDEVSMIDTVLMYALLKAVKAGSRLILIGDPDQLPSVGPGKVLAEIIRSGAVPHLHLDAVFRQAQASRIVENAHRIRHGEAPLPGGNFHMIACGDGPDIPARVADLVSDTLPARFGHRPMEDIQVLSPMNQGPFGTVALNQALQARLNPLGTGIEHRDRLFRAGDKVMQLRNDYDKNVFNGDIGYVKSVSTVRKTLTVDFDGEEAVYEGEELDQLTLAYAVSVHKSQGSEFKAVVLLLTRAHWVMLQRNLLYTAITRARDDLVLVAQGEAVRRAVEHNPSVQRNTLLAEAIREEMESGAFA